jgi:hypothetical protein
MKSWSLDLNLIWIIILSSSTGLLFLVFMAVAAVWQLLFVLVVTLYQCNGSHISFSCLMIGRRILTMLNVEVDPVFKLFTQPKPFRGRISSVNQ